MSNVRGARFVNSRDMQMPRYSSYRDTVGTEYNIIFCCQNKLDFFFLYQKVSEASFTLTSNKSLRIFVVLLWDV